MLSVEARAHRLMKAANNPSLPFARGRQYFQRVRMSLDSTQGELQGLEVCNLQHVTSRFLNVPLQDKSGTPVLGHWIKVAFRADLDPAVGAWGVFTSPIQPRVLGTWEWE